MKRILLGVLAAGIVLSIGATTVFASGMHDGQGNAFCLSGVCQTSSCSNYVDADGDGLCDNHSANHDGCGNRAAWSGAGHHNGCREECRDSRCGANRR